MAASQDRVRLLGEDELEEAVLEEYRAKYGDKFGRQIVKLLRVHQAADVLHQQGDRSPEAVEEARRAVATLSGLAVHISQLYGLPLSLQSGTGIIPSLTPEPTPTPAAPVLPKSVPDLEPEELVETEVDSAVSPATTWSLDAMVASFETMETSRTYD